MQCKLGNYNIFLIAKSIAFFAGGLYGPFWFLFVRDFGNSIEQFSYAMFLILLAQSITAYFMGKYSDKLGRKPFLIISGLAFALVLFAYTQITSIIQLYILQVLDGIASQTTATITTTYLGDVTKNKSRGGDVGKYHMITGFAIAFAVLFGGLLVGKYGYASIFYIAAGLEVVATLMIAYVKETVNKNCK